MNRYKVLDAVLIGLFCLGWLTLGTLGVIALQREAQAAGLAQAAPPLANPGFEGAFPPHDGVGELRVGEGWRPWWDSALFRPEYGGEVVGVGMGRVRAGRQAQKLFTVYARHDGGIYQVVEGVTPGQWYTFEVWAWLWSSQQDDPTRSPNDGKCSVMAGINPWGDERALYRTTVWGREALQVYDQWVRVSVTAQAWRDRIVVYARHTCEWPVKHNDVYLDDARLALATEVGVTPAPTYTPQPTYTPYPTPEPAPGAEVDYERIREIVATVIAERDPVRWPR